MKEHTTQFVSFVKDAADYFSRIPPHIRRELPTIKKRVFLRVEEWTVGNLFKRNIITKEEYEKAQSELRLKTEKL